MATGASTANLAIVLVDARHGVLPQTRRHAFIASLLGTPHIVVAVNKMDLVDWRQRVFEAIEEEFTRFAAQLPACDLHFIPISALLGDNVVEKSRHMPWFQGESLLHHLVGCGVLRVAEGQMGLTEYGSRLSNIVLRGTININVGGYGSQVANIGPLLRKEVTREEIEESHSGFHSGLGTEQLTSVRLVPSVLKILAERNLHSMLHLACAAGGFLVQVARSDPSFRGIGIDKSAQKIAKAHEKLRRYGLESRIRLIQEEIGVEPLPLDEQTRSQIDVVASIYLLHEIGRYGRQRIVDVLRQIKASFPGKLFLFSETMPPNTPDSVRKQPSQYSQLDYLLIHRLRGKGMPLPAEEWKSIIADAGLKLIEFKEVYSIGLFLAEL